LIDALPQADGDGAAGHQSSLLARARNKVTAEEETP
jgi:hypothetical protein